MSAYNNLSLWKANEQKPLLYTDHLDFKIRTLSYVLGCINYHQWVKSAPSAELVSGLTF